MKINPNSWHYRRYKRWERWKLRTKYRYEPRTTLDLCHYMRVVLIFYWWRWPWQRELFGTDLRPWMALPVTVALGGIGIGIYGLTQVHDWLAVGVITGEVVGLIVLTVIVIFALIYAVDEKDLHTKIGKKVGESEILHLGAAWIKAKKSHVCPILEVDDD